MVLETQYLLLARIWHYIHAAPSFTGTCFCSAFLIPLYIKLCVCDFILQLFLFTLLYFLQFCIIFKMYKKSLSLYICDKYSNQHKYVRPRIKSYIYWIYISIPTNYSSNLTHCFITLHSDTASRLDRCKCVFSFIISFYFRYRIWVCISACITQHFSKFKVLQLLL